MAWLSTELLEFYFRAGTKASAGICSFCCLVSSLLNNKGFYISLIHLIVWNLQNKYSWRYLKWGTLWHKCSWSLFSPEPNRRHLWKPYVTSFTESSASQHEYRKFIKVKYGENKWGLVWATLLGRILTATSAERHCWAAMWSGHKNLKIAHKIVSSDPMSTPCPHQPLWAELKAEVWMSLEDVLDKEWSYWHDISGVIMLLHQFTEAWDMNPAGDIPPHLPNMPFPWKWSLLY